MKLYGNYTPEISEISDDVVWFVWDGAGGITGPMGYNFPGSWKVYEAEDTPAARAASGADCEEGQSRTPKPPAETLTTGLRRSLPIAHLSCPVWCGVSWMGRGAVRPHD